MILLASGSPQRRELLEQLGYPIRIVVPGVDEVEEGAPPAIASTNAAIKGRALTEELRDGEVLVACDTVVDIDGVALGKPVDESDARAMLTRLAGRTHIVWSGLYLAAREASGVLREAETLVGTQVEFRAHTEDRLERYIVGEEWRGRAGGYAIQGTGAAFVREVRGCYPNVVGLPIAALTDVLEQIDGWEVRARRTYNRSTERS